MPRLSRVLLVFIGARDFAVKLAAFCIFLALVEALIVARALTFSLSDRISDTAIAARFVRNRLAFEQRACHRPRNTPI